MASFRETLTKYQMSNGNKMTKNKFVYGDRKKLTQKSNNIFCLFLIESKEFGPSLMEFEFKRATAMDHKQWAEFLKNKGIEIYMTAVLPAINNKHGHDWVLKKFLGYGFNSGLRREAVNAIRESSNTTTINRRNKTVKKGGASVH